MLHSTGIFTLPVSCLKEPPPTLKVRDIKEWYVDYLVEMMSNDDQGELTSPLLVVASVGKSDQISYLYL